ncbi:uncharacterized protein [Diadema setosum]|uniref:uncharacterized protein n=1 Tax=Diadema setosum TaxID=31175 RepID=UPI003B3B9753
MSMRNEVDVERFQVASSLLTLGMDNLLMPISIHTNEPDFNRAIASVIWSRHHQQTTCQIFNCHVPNCPLCPGAPRLSAPTPDVRPAIQQLTDIPKPSARRSEVVNWLVSPSPSQQAPARDRVRHQTFFTRHQHVYPAPSSLSSAASPDSSGSARSSPNASDSCPSISPDYLVEYRRNSSATVASPPSSSGQPGELPFACRHCPKRFAQASNRSSHMRTHTGDRPFRCPSCPKSFAQRTSLRTHLRTHTGDRPYRCLDCDQRFGDLSTLTKHRRTHTGEKPYRCHYEGCSRAFAQSGNLKRHFRTHVLDRKLERISA